MLIFFSIYFVLNVLSLLVVEAHIPVKKQREDGVSPTKMGLFFLGFGSVVFLTFILLDIYAGFTDET